MYMHVYLLWKGLINKLMHRSLVSYSDALSVYYDTDTATDRVSISTSEDSSSNEFAPDSDGQLTKIF